MSLTRTPVYDEEQDAASVPSTDAAEDGNVKSATAGDQDPEDVFSDYEHVEESDVTEPWDVLYG